MSNWGDNWAMSSVTVQKTDSSSLPDLKIEIPASCFPLSHPKTVEGVAALQQIIDLAATVADSIDHVQSQIRDLRCDCLLDRLNDPVRHYAEKLKALYPYQATSTTPVSKQATGLAIFIGAKVRLRRELKAHVGLIEGMLWRHGENLKVVELFTPDVDLLTELGREVAQLIDLILAQGTKPCQNCEKERAPRAGSSQLPRTNPLTSANRVERSKTVLSRARTLLEKTRSQNVTPKQRQSRSEGSASSSSSPLSSLSSIEG